MSSDLLQRLEAAQEGSRELDAKLACVYFGWTFERMPLPSEGSSGFFAIEDGRLVRFHDFQPFTTSVDAALALVERMLPGRVITVDRYVTSDVPGGDTWRAWLRTVTEVSVSKVMGKAPTPAMALCIALLKALSPSPASLDEEEGSVVPLASPSVPSPSLAALDATPSGGVK